MGIKLEYLKMLGDIWSEKRKTAAEGTVSPGTLQTCHLELLFATVLNIR